MADFQTILSVISPVCKHAELQTDESASPKAILIHANDLIEVCNTLLTHEALYFDMLSCITAIDNGPEANSMELVYNLYAIPYEHHLMLKVKIERANPEIPSVSDIWKTADWHEREAFDLFGIKFKNHPDLRRILLPADWEGYPLRKDYKVQEYYAGIKVETETKL
ncbi:MAG TPA: NADH-quinone oxidoreductase subunit C, partial [Cyclobacteriaceae bacterium]|nr:NADH-quinone oxidoreductase subunit C [Cyclobacteriaceae bacterium]